MKQLRSERISPRHIALAFTLLGILLCLWTPITMSQSSSTTTGGAGALTPPWDQTWAWEGAPDCDDPHEEYDSECWACEGDDSDKVAVPKFKWEKTIEQCPDLELKPPTTKQVTFCLDPFTKVEHSVSAPAYEITKKGKRKWIPNPSSCGTEHPEEFGFSAFKWKWKVEAECDVEPKEGEGDEAQFIVDVPEKGYKVDVIFQLTAIPEDPDCPEVKKRKAKRPLCLAISNSFRFRNILGLSNQRQILDLVRPIRAAPRFW